MHKAFKVVLDYYQKSETKRVQGNRQSIQTYLNQGFTIKESNYGNWTLIKCAKVYITVDCGNNATYTLEMSWGIKTHYGAVRISESLVKQFIDDCNSGRVEVYTDGSHYEIRAHG